MNCNDYWPNAYKLTLEYAKSSGCIKDLLIPEDKTNRLPLFSAIYITCEGEFDVDMIQTLLDAADEAGCLGRMLTDYETVERQSMGTEVQFTVFDYVLLEGRPDILEVILNAAEKAKCLESLLQRFIETNSETGDYDRLVDDGDEIFIIFSRGMQAKQLSLNKWHARSR